jgi:DNA-binding XRE family transcriptional regulator
MQKYPNIEAERARMGLTRRQTAEALGVKRDTYCDWLNGKYPIPANFCVELASLFGCSVEYLLSSNERKENWKRFSLHRLYD